jgi:hypothetical protein
MPALAKEADADFLVTDDIRPPKCWGAALFCFQSNLKTCRVARQYSARGYKNRLSASGGESAKKPKVQDIYVAHRMSAIPARQMRWRPSPLAAPMAASDGLGGSLILLCTAQGIPPGFCIRTA